MNFFGYKYDGCFTVPPSATPDFENGFAGSDGNICFHDGGLWLTGHHREHGIAKVSIPDVLSQAVSSDMVQADVVKPLCDPAANCWNFSDHQEAVTGLCVVTHPRGCQWLVQAIRSGYNVTDQYPISHVATPLSRLVSGGARRVLIAQGGPEAHNNRTTGYLTEYKGRILSGCADPGFFSGSSIYGSYGPAAFEGYLWDATGRWYSDLEMTPWIYYPEGDPIPAWAYSITSVTRPAGPVGVTSAVGGIEWIDGLGLLAIGAEATMREYGEPAQPGPDGIVCPTSPCDTAKGWLRGACRTAAYLYRTIDGTQSPWRYAYDRVDLDELFDLTCYHGIGLTRDRLRDRIYVAKGAQLQIGYNFLPVIHQFSKA